MKQAEGWQQLSVKKDEPGMRCGWMPALPKPGYEGLIKDVAVSRKDSVSASTVSTIAMVSGICFLGGVLMPG